MTLRISSAVLDAIVAEANASPAREVCGLLFGSAERITRADSCRNAANHPADSFEIDPQALIAAHRAARRGGPQIVGCYHSHPNGCPEPSARDSAAAEEGAVWVIVAGNEVGVWRLEQGNFAPMQVDAS